MNLDPHLQAALRHAPDHDAAPPPALSAAILRAGRVAVDRGRRGGGWRGWSGWLWGAGGLGVAVAMGWSALVLFDVAPALGPRTPDIVVAQGDPAARRESPADGAAPRPSPVPATPAAEPAPAVPAQTQPSTQAQPPTPATAPPAGRAMAPATTAASNPAAARALGEARAKASQPPPDTEARTDLAARARTGTAGEQASDAAAARAGTPTDDARTGAGTAANEAETGAAGTAAKREAAPAAPARARQAESTAGAGVPAIAAARPAAPRDGLTARAEEAEALRLTRPEQLRTHLAAEAGRWQWQPPDGNPPRPVDAAALAWLDRLALAAGAQRWEPQMGALPPGATTTWLRDGQPEVEVRIARDGVLWRGAGAPAQWLPLSPLDLEALTRRF